MYVGRLMMTIFYDIESPLFIRFTPKQCKSESLLGPLKAKIKFERQGKFQ